MVLSGDSVHHQQLNATLCLLRPVAGWSILVSFEEFRSEVVGLWFVEQPGHSTFLIASCVDWRVDAEVILGRVSMQWERVTVAGNHRGTLCPFTSQS